MPSVPTNCPFCPENGKVKIIEENDAAYLVAALQDGKIMPYAFLIVPKEHIESIFELPATWWGNITELAEKVPGIGENFNLSLNVGPKAGQRLPHLHFWVLPRDHEDEDWLSHELGFATVLERLNSSAYTT